MLNFYILTKYNCIINLISFAVKYLSGGAAERISIDVLFNFLKTKIMCLFKTGLYVSGRTV